MPKRIESLSALHEAFRDNVSVIARIFMPSCETKEENVVLVAGVPMFENPRFQYPKVVDYHFKNPYITFIAYA